MPRSSNPAVLVYVVLYTWMGAFFLALGIAFSSGLDWGLLFGIPMLLGGVSSLVGAYGLVKKWRQAVRDEKATADSLRRTVAEGDPLYAQHVLAHWVYDAEEWAAYTKRERSFRRGQTVMAALGTGAVVTLGGMMAGGGAGALAVGGGVGVLVGIANAVRAAAANRANRSTPLAEAIITRSTILFNGRYLVLQDHQYRFGGVRFLEHERPPILELTVRWEVRRGTRSARYRIPVPRGHEDEARALLHRFPHADAGAPSLASVG